MTQRRMWMCNVFFVYQSSAAKQDDEDHKDFKHSVLNDEETCLPELKPHLPRTLGCVYILDRKAVVTNWNAKVLISSCFHIISQKNLTYDITFLSNEERRLNCKIKEGFLLRTPDRSVHTWTAAVSRCVFCQISVVQRLLHPITL